MNIVIVGGGERCLVFLKQCELMDDFNVLGMVDLNPNAVGITQARTLGIETGSDIASILRHSGVDLVIEVTGAPRVRVQVLSLLRPNQEIITDGGARIMIDMIAAQKERDAGVAEELSSQFGVAARRLDEATQSIDTAFQHATDVLREMSLVTINGRIEAARADRAGTAFGVVVERMQEMIGQTHGIIKDINAASESNRSTLGSLNDTKRRFQDVFSSAAMPAETP